MMAVIRKRHGTKYMDKIEDDEESPGQKFLREKAAKALKETQVRDMMEANRPSDFALSYMEREAYDEFHIKVRDMYHECACIMYDFIKDNDSIKGRDDTIDILQKVDSLEDQVSDLQVKLKEKWAPISALK